MNWDMYYLEKKRLVKANIPGSQASEQAYRYVAIEESQERRLLQRAMLN